MAREVTVGPAGKWRLRFGAGLAAVALSVMLILHPFAEEADTVGWVLLFTFAVLDFIA